MEQFGVMERPTYSPGNEPYLGRPPLHAFDTLIAAAMEVQLRVGPWTRRHDAELTRLQHAASQLVPGACSIALSIRELVRQAYLYSAMILLRPLVERIGTLSYLAEHPQAVEVWEAGWGHGRRPPFAALLESMKATPEVPDDVGAFDALRALAGNYHSLIHGDPASAEATLIALADGGPGYTVGKDVSSPERADLVCLQASAYLAVLTVRTVELFPEAFQGDGAVTATW
jgi:hypothetical protein